MIVVERLAQLPIVSSARFACMPGSPPHWGILVEAITEREGCRVDSITQVRSSWKSKRVCDGCGTARLPLGPSSSSGTVVHAIDAKSSTVRSICPRPRCFDIAAVLGGEAACGDALTRFLHPPGCPPVEAMVGQTDGYSTRPQRQMERAVAKGRRYQLPTDARRAPGAPRR
eukprot:CAMPEP_0177794586 /NCGR_PEP_ID=MMETSP0491_2-20121128/25732_1 /TAXON_ID=63592 /ORGANISM="Tetraselmis chuii, Strain PLY429" /LENGTH=170 /DNA_ID=CAMNT_0019317267 /DNA_START=333 /DNA_END=847 /DNA_ORIENTATION=+